MFGFRTPAKKTSRGSTSPTQHQTGSQSPIATSTVRRSIGEWESVNRESRPEPSPPVTKAIPSAPQKPKLKPALSQEGKAPLARRASVEAVDIPDAPVSRLEEARACLNRAKLYLSSSRNLKTDLKEGITAAVDRLYKIIKEAEAELSRERKGKKEKDTKCIKQTAEPECDKIEIKEKKEDSLILERIEENNLLLHEQGRRIEELKSIVVQQRETIEKATYASVTAIEPCQKPTLDRPVLHSIVVTSTDEQETGEEVLEKVRKAVDAKEGWVQVERVRKAKDRKVIMGCKTKEERNKIKERLEAAGQNLVVEEVKNRDPLLILRDVLLIHNDDVLLKALRNQNRGVFQGLDNGEDRAEVKFRKRSRNPQNNHVVLCVSPIIWKRATEIGRLKIDLQSVHVWDQTPLIQCTRCLGYGHSKKHCIASDDLCSHCSGPHLRTDCPQREAGEGPVCKNCTDAKKTDCKHNAFDIECPVRKKWDTLARACIAYC